MQREIEDSAHRYQREVERRAHYRRRQPLRERSRRPRHGPAHGGRIIRERQSERLAELKTRDNAAVERAGRPRAAAEGSDNLLYPTKEALANLATVGEVSDVLRGVFGEYRPV